MSHPRAFTQCPCCRRGRQTDADVVKRAEKAGRVLLCRSCAARERVRDKAKPAEWKARALLLRSRGYNFREVADHLRDEGKSVSSTTIAVWVNEVRA